jgi:hypothetical protein
MQRDRFHVKDGLLLTEGELRIPHRLTFHHAVNLMLVLGDTQVRAADVPSLIEAFGCCSVMRDLREDLEKGLVNVPLSVVERARSTGAVALDCGSLVGSPAVLQWLQAEHARAATHLDQSEIERASLGSANDRAGLLLETSLRQLHIAFGHRVVR